MERRHEHGRGAVGCLFSLVVIGALVVIGLKAVPARIAVAELQDYAVRQAESASLPGFSDEEISKHILEKARELKLPVEASALRVSRGGGEVRVQLHYSMPLDFGFYTYRWEVDHNIERVLF